MVDAAGQISWENECESFLENEQETLEFFDNGELYNRWVMANFLPNQYLPLYSNDHKPKLWDNEGFRDTLARHGLPVVDEWILPGRADFEHGVAATQRLLAAHPQITAIFCYNDVIAMGAIQACKDSGRRVPEDCAIVGFDNIQFAAMVNPPLTTIHVNKYKLGQQAIQCLLTMLRNPGTPVPPVYADVELIIRQSA